MTASEHLPASAAPPGFMTWAQAVSEVADDAVARDHVTAGSSNVVIQVDGTEVKLTVRDQTAVMSDDNLVVTTEAVVRVTAITADRTITLPPAAAVLAGFTVTVVDESGDLNDTDRVVTILPDSGDTIANPAAPDIDDMVPLTDPYGTIQLMSNGSNRWVVTTGVLPEIISTVADALVEGNNISIDYDDGTGTITISSTGGGGGGAVDSVNGQTGVVTIDADDVGAAALAGNNEHQFANSQDSWLEVRIPNDGSPNGEWPDRLSFWYEHSAGQWMRTGWFNEFGEIRATSSNNSRVAMRVHGYSNNQTQSIFVARLFWGGPELFAVNPASVDAQVPINAPNIGPACIELDVVDAVPGGTAVGTLIARTEAV